MRIWNSLRGYVMIKVEGLYLERFLNLCMMEGIGIWGVNRRSRTVMFARVGVNDFSRLRPIVRRTGCRVAITRRVGTLFWFTRFRFRKLLIGGAVAALAVLYLLTSYVWGIEFVNAGSNEAAAYMRQLEDIGVRVGVFRSSLDLKAIEHALIAGNENVVWANARLTGVKLSIEVAKKEDAPELSDTGTPARIIAAKDAVVESIIVLQGKRVAEKGQTVVRGEELISGVLDYTEDSPSYVHAQGEVMGRVWYTKRASLPVDTLNTSETGNAYTLRYLSLGGWEVPLDPEHAPYENAREETATYGLLDEGLFMRAQVRAVTYHELKVETVEADMDALKLSAQAKAWNAVKEDIPPSAVIKARDFVFSIQSGRLVCEARVETLENIGKTVKIG